MRGLARGKLANVDFGVLKNAISEDEIVNAINREVAGLTQTRLSGNRNARKVETQAVGELKASNQVDKLSTRLLADVKDIKYEVVPKGLGLEIVLSGMLSFRLVPGGYAQSRRRVSDSPTLSALQLRCLLTWAVCQPGCYLSIGDISRAFNMSKLERPCERCLLAAPKNLWEAVSDPGDARLLWRKGEFMLTFVSIYGTLYGSSEWFLTLTEYLLGTMKFEQYWYGRALFRTSKSEGEDEARLGSHVDDMMLASGSAETGRAIENGISERYPVKKWEVVCAGRGDVRRRVAEYCGKDIVSWVEGVMEMNSQGRTQLMDIRYTRVDLQRKVGELKFIKIEFDDTSVQSRKESMGKKCSAKELATFRAIVGSLGFIVEWFPQLFAKRKVVIHKITNDSPKFLLEKINDIISELKCHPHASWTTRSISPMQSLEFSDASFQLSEADLHELKECGMGLSEVEKSGRFPLMGRMHCLLHRQGSLPYEQLEKPIMVPLDYDVVRLQRRVWSIHGAEMISGRVTRMDNAHVRRTWEWVNRASMKSDLVLDSDSVGRSVTSNGTPTDTPGEALNSLLELRDQYSRGHFDLLHTADENNPVDLLTKVGQEQSKLDRFRSWVQTCVWESLPIDKKTRRFKTTTKDPLGDKGLTEILEESRIMDDRWVVDRPEETGEQCTDEWFVGSLADKEAGFKAGVTRRCNEKSRRE